MSVGGGEERREGGRIGEGEQVRIRKGDDGQRGMLRGGGRGFPNQIRCECIQIEKIFDRTCKKRGEFDKAGEV